MLGQASLKLAETSKERGRATKLAEEVCLHAEKLEGGVTAEAVCSNKELINAVAETWDGSALKNVALSMPVCPATVRP